MKQYVTVIVRFEENGRVRPISIEWTDGRRFSIDRVTRICPAASLKSGGAGIRFTCWLGKNERYLYWEGQEKWFIEAP